MNVHERIRLPIINLYNNLIIPIQGSLPDYALAQLQTDVAARIVQERAFGVVVDVSGVTVIDSYFTRILRDMSLMAKLMGAHTVISGVHPHVAITMVEMGMEIPGVKTTLSLERALEHLAELAFQQEVMSKTDGTIG